MKKHKLSLDDTFEKNFYLFALYTDEEDYRLAFLLNQHLNLQLKRSSSIISGKEKVSFSIFEYEDESLYRNWFLIQNHSFTEKEVSNPDDLFSQHPTVFNQKSVFFAAYKKANFFLKIATDDGELFYNNLVDKLQRLSQIYTIELINLSQLKNKHLFLF